MVFQLDRLLPILQCPRTGEELRLENDRLLSNSGEEYPVINGIPILVRQIQPFHITPPEQAFISKNTASYSPPHHLRERCICLHLGSGDVPAQDERVISLDILPTGSVDIVAEAEALPFKTHSLDYMESGAVFEHVFHPLQSAAEVRRVLKDGGELSIDTAFLQGYHGFPSHFFNMTPQAVETYICDDFVLLDSFVPSGAMVTHALTEQFYRFLELIPSSDRDQLTAMPLGDALALIKLQKNRASGLPAKISEYGHRALAASFVVQARKPKNYENADRAAASSLQDRAAYYAARMGIIQRHHEIGLYQRFALEKHGDGAPPHSDQPRNFPISYQIAASRTPRPQMPFRKQRQNLQSGTRP